MHKTLVVWWRFGKEHGEEDFRVNPPEVIAAHLDTKSTRFRQTPERDWRWWQVDDSLLVERAQPDDLFFGEDTRIYYLPMRGMAVVKNIHLKPPHDVWSWYLHLADVAYDTERACWVKQDLFCDILIAPDARTHRVIDLDDLATALEVGLISTAQASAILRRTEALTKAIAHGEFPFPEIERGRAACRELGW